MEWVPALPQPDDRISARSSLSRFLLGSGVELGPGHRRFVHWLPGSTTRYVDRWDPDENHRLFAALGSDAPFPKPDIVADLDTDRLAPLSDESQDFVVASHVLEHLADPLGQIGEIFRVLRPGGVALLILPDRHETFDRRRAATPLAHVIADHRDRVTVVADEHIEDYLRNTDPPAWNDAWTEEERRVEFDLNRRRSVHVHCWSQDEFLPVLDHAARVMGMRWELLDASFTNDVADGFEFGFALRRSTCDVDPSILADRLRLTWVAIDDQRQASRRASAELRRRAEHAEAQVARITTLPGYALARRVWRIGQRVGDVLVHRPPARPADRRPRSAR